MAHRDTQALFRPALPLMPGELMRSDLPHTALAAFLGGFVALIISRAPILQAILQASMAATVIVVCLALVELRGDGKHADVDAKARADRADPEKSKARHMRIER